MNETLKAAGHIGAELGAAMAEIEALREQVKVLQSDANSWQSGYDKGRHDGARHRKGEVQQLRGLLRRSLDYFTEPGMPEDLLAEYRAALSHQAEPTDTFTAVDMATAAARGFRDGQAAVEQALAQDERKTFEVEIPDISAIYDGRSFIPYRSLEAGERLMTVAQHLRIEKQLRAALTRPAQTEQQPVCWASSSALAKLQNGRNNSPCVLTDGPAEFNDTPLYAAPQPEQSVPEGFALVPENPTMEMIAALGFEGDEVAAIGHASIFSEMTERYGAMLAVAPSPAMDSQQ